MSNKTQMETMLEAAFPTPPEEPPANAGGKGIVGGAPTDINLDIMDVQEATEDSLRVLRNARNLVLEDILKAKAELESVKEILIASVIDAQKGILRVMNNARDLALGEILAAGAAAAARVDPQAVVEAAAAAVQAAAEAAASQAEAEASAVAQAAAEAAAEAAAKAAAKAAEIKEVMELLISAGIVVPAPAAPVAAKPSLWAKVKKEWNRPTP